MSNSESRRGPQGGSAGAPAGAPDAASTRLSGRAPSRPPDASDGVAVSALDLAVDESGWITVVRREDLLRLRFKFVGLHIHDGTLVLDSTTNPGVIVVELPPQHVVEPVVREPTNGGPPTNVPPRPIDARIAGMTRIAFVVPTTTTSIPYSLEGVLDACTSLGLNVADNALAASDDPPPSFGAPAPASQNPDEAIAKLQALSRLRAKHEVESDTLPPFDPGGGGGPAPGATIPDSRTAIELPYRVILSPSSSLRFAHSPTPYRPGTSALTELWTTRLTRAMHGRADETTRTPVSVRAIWSPDLGAPSDPFPGAMALDKEARVELVRLSADFTRTRTRPIHARRLILSARGGSLDARAEFDPAPPLTLASWQHRASFGRDDYVRVEKEGVLFPYGHRASVVIVSERKFLENPNHGIAPRTAYLWQRYFVVVRTPLVNYSASPVGADWAFQQIRILTPSTPPLDAIPARLDAFWPTIGGVAYRFSAQLVDLEGNVSSADLAAIWLPNAFSESRLGAVKTDFETAVDPTGALRCASDFHRQSVAYAPTEPPRNGRGPTVGKTTFETRTITFGASIPAPPGPSIPEGPRPIIPTPPHLTSFVAGEGSGFVPRIRSTQVGIPSLRQFCGADQPITMEYAPAFLSSRFSDSGNPGEVFLALAAGATPLAVDFGAQSQRAGAFMTPNMSIIGLSRQVGPMAGTAAGDVAAQINAFATKGAADPKMLFGALAGTKLFGVFALTDLFAGALPLGSLPKFATETLDVIATLLRTANQVQGALAALKAAAPPSPPSELAIVLGQVSALDALVSSFVKTVSQLPPSDPAGFVKAASDELLSLAGALEALRTAVSTARRANSDAPPALRLDDGVFAQLDALVRAASAMLPAGPALPAELTGALTAIADISQAIANMTSRFEWQTSPNDIRALSVLSFDDVFAPGTSPPTILKLVGEVRAHEVAGKPAGLDLTATLNNFDINLLGKKALPFIKLSFDHLRFASMAGQKPSIDVGFRGISFQGDLKFLNELRSIIPLDGFGDPPGITVSSEGIEGAFTLALPTLAVGIFSLENLSLSARFHIPFIGEPMTVGFHFSEREAPFHLTVSLLGGGGYFLLDLSMRGIILVEASIEFGAEVALNLVVASGSALLMAGIYYSYKPDGVKLAGYVRVAGSLSVLGLISASIELRLELGYKSHPDRAYGTATLTIEISILFFSVSVNITCEKSFGSSNADPTFAESMGPESPTGSPPSAWDEYCAAFAA